MKGCPMYSLCSTSSGVYLPARPYATSSSCKSDAWMWKFSPGHCCVSQDEIRVDLGTTRARQQQYLEALSASLRVAEKSSTGPLSARSCAGAR